MWVQEDEVSEAEGLILKTPRELPVNARQKSWVKGWAEL